MLLLLWEIVPRLKLTYTVSNTRVMRSNTFQYVPYPLPAPVYRTLLSQYNICIQ